MTKAHLRRTGHVIRMGNDRLLKKVLYGELNSENAGVINKNASKTPISRVISQSININFGDTATDRSEWRAIINKGCKHFEEDRHKKPIETVECNAKSPVTACTFLFLSVHSLAPHGSDYTAI